MSTIGIIGLALIGVWITVFLVLSIKNDRK